MKNISRRELAIILVTLGLILVPLFLVGGYFYSKHQWAMQRIAEVEPRHARLSGLLAQKDSLALAQSQTMDLLAQYLHPAGQDANQVGNDVQQRIRSVLSTAGLSIISTQVLPAKDGKSFERIPLSIRAEGDMMAVQLALAALDEQTPAILTEGFVLQAAAAPVKGVQKLAVQLNLLILKGKS